ncbi:MAG: InlB B-repeat-containing protein [Fastidiosipilaceae bacterium]|jgi:hypothetical protein
MSRKYVTFFATILSLLFSFSFVTSGVHADENIVIDADHFPDETFRKFVISFDKNKDGQLSDSEREAVTEIDLQNESISDLTGLEYFTKLTQLNCRDNQLEVLNVSQNKALTELDCGLNNLQTLDVRANALLEELYCDGNQLASLDVKTNLALTTLNCADNQLKDLDLSQNIDLKHLDSGTNGLKTLSLNKNIALESLNIKNNNLQVLDISQLSKLTDLDCSDNGLVTLSLEKNPDLKTLYCSNNLLTALDLSDKKELVELDFSNNRISSLNLNTKRPLTRLNGIDNEYNVLIGVSQELDPARLPGQFDVTKTSQWVGAKLDGNIIRIDDDAEIVTYRYDLGQHQTLPFKLTVSYKERVTVSFDTDGGNLVEPIVVDRGTPVTEPPVPEKFGYTFKCWQLGKLPYKFENNVNKDITLQAIWTINRYAVTFDSMGGSLVFPSLQNHGTYVLEPMPPYREGYTFVEWQLDGEPYDFRQPISGNVGLTAIWEINQYEVEFDSADGTPVTSETVNYNSTVAEPEAPSKEGYTFKEWQYKGKAYYFEQPVTEDLQLQAVWEIDQFNVIFNTDGGSEIDSDIVNYNETICEPKVPVKEGYTFVEWQLDGEPYDFEQPVTKDLQLQAIWKENLVKAVNQRDHSSIIIPTEPSAESTDNRKDHETGDRIGNKKTADRSSQSTGRSAIKNAPGQTQPIIKQVTVTFDSNGGSSIAPLTVEIGTQVIVPQPPTKENAEFQGWYFNGKPFDLGQPINQDILLTARWSTDDEFWVTSVSSIAAVPTAPLQLTAEPEPISGDRTASTDAPTLTSSVQPTEITTTTNTTSVTETTTSTESEPSTEASESLTESPIASTEPSDPPTDPSILKGDGEAPINANTNLREGSLRILPQTGQGYAAMIVAIILLIIAVVLFVIRSIFKKKK